jgi:hypothetical protein
MAPHSNSWPVTYFGHPKRTSGQLHRYRREASRADLLTYLVAANGDLRHYPTLARAVWHWRSIVPQRRPFCSACKVNFADGALPGAFLLSTTAAAPTTASVTAFCARCFDTMTLAEIETICERVLKTIVPGGTFEPLPV